MSKLAAASPSCVFFTLHRLPSLYINSFTPGFIWPHGCTVEADISMLFYICWHGRAALLSQRFHYKRGSTVNLAACDKRTCLCIILTARSMTLSQPCVRSGLRNRKITVHYLTICFQAVWLENHEFLKRNKGNEVQRKKKGVNNQTGTRRHRSWILILTASSSTSAQMASHVNWRSATLAACERLLLLIWGLVKDAGLQSL